MAAQPGWYDDGSGRDRYWDGEAWGGYRDNANPAERGSNRDQFEYHAELISVSEKVLGRTGSGSHGSVKGISDRFTQLSTLGWEFVDTARVPVVGKVFKADDHRTLTVAIFRRRRQPGTG